MDSIQCKTGHMTFYEKIGQYLKKKKKKSGGGDYRFMNINWTHARSSEKIANENLSLPFFLS